MTVRVTNVLRAPEKFGWQYATPTLTDVDGKELHWSSDVIDAGSGQSVGSELAPGKAYSVRYVFDGEPGRKVKEFRLASNVGRTIVVDVR